MVTSKPSISLEAERNVEARMMVLRHARTVLYTTETPKIEAQTLMSGFVMGTWTIFLTTNLPDGVIYKVTWEGVHLEPTLKAYKQLEDDITPHN